MQLESGIDHFQVPEITSAISAESPYMSRMSFQTIETYPGWLRRKKIPQQNPLIVRNNIFFLSWATKSLGDLLRKTT